MPRRYLSGMHLFLLVIVVCAIFAFHKQDAVMGMICEAWHEHWQIVAAVGWLALYWLNPSLGYELLLPAIAIIGFSYMARGWHSKKSQKHRSTER